MHLSCFFFPLFCKGNLDSMDNRPGTPGQPRDEVLGWLREEADFCPPQPGRHPRVPSFWGILSILHDGQSTRTTH
jgi:hypothetical protein